MPTAIGKIFMNGRSQAVRLPKEFRLPGKEVSIRAVPGGLLLEPVEQSAAEIYAEMDSYPPFDFERNQPPIPTDDEVF